MAVVTVRNLSEETHRALKVRAAQHGRSTEAEIRAILEEAARPAKRVLLGSALAALGAQFDFPELKIRRDSAPAEPATFE